MSALSPLFAGQWVKGLPLSRFALAAEAGGGNFANGAFTAFYSYLVPTTLTLSRQTPGAQPRAPPPQNADPVLVASAGTSTGGSLVGIGEWEYLGAGLARFFAWLAMLSLAGDTNAGYAGMTDRWFNPN
jgi:hypothetical protein